MNTTKNPVYTTYEEIKDYLTSGTHIWSGLTQREAISEYVRQGKLTVDEGERMLQEITIPQTPDALSQLDTLSTRGFNISHNAHKREGMTLEEAVDKYRQMGRLGPKQAEEILTAKKLIAVTAYIDGGLFYVGVAATVEDAVDRVLKMHNCILAVW